MAAGNENVIIGFEAALDNTRDGLVIIGSHAGRSLSSGDNNVFVGFNTGPGVTTGDHNTLVGDEAGRVSSVFRALMKQGSKNSEEENE